MLIVLLAKIISKRIRAQVWNAFTKNNHLTALQIYLRLLETSNKKRMEFIFNKIDRWETTQISLKIDKIFPKIHNLNWAQF